MAKNLLDILRQTNKLPPVESPELPATEEGGGYMDDFFAEIDGLKKQINQIREDVTQVRVKQSEILSAPQQDPKTKAVLEELDDGIKTSAGQVRMRLKQLGVSISKQEEREPNSAATLIRKTQHAATTRGFIDVMNMYNDAQVTHRDACKARIKRQMEIAERYVNDEELEEMLESGSPHIFTQGILTDTQQARRNLADIQARHEDIIKLEKSIRELNELFMDMANLVSAQGELIDRIDYNVAQTKDHVEEARAQTNKAVIYKKKSRKKKFIIIGVCSGIVVLIIIIVVASVVPRR